MENFPDQTTPDTPPEQSGSMQNQSETGYGISSNGVDMTADDARAENERLSGESENNYFGNYAAAEQEAEKQEAEAFPGWYGPTEEEPIKSIDPTKYQGTAVPENPTNSNPPVISQSPENPITANEPNTVIGQQPTPEEGIKEA
ncbi:hypothetical protein IKG29_01860 [Candidatus Saccharibacteria bacterium]|nr:hypothetical protein [Candidatus Saccharibacteria bacterium]